jgi:hypothetical protein
MAKGQTKDISPRQYAKWWGHHVSYVHRLLLNEEISKMPFVISVKKYSRFYTLEVPYDLTADSFELLTPYKK